MEQQRLFSETERFDFLLEGTSLDMCLLSAAIAKNAAAVHKKVLHVDPNSFYGSQHATLYPSQIGKSPLEKDRKFFIDLSPKLLFGTDAPVDALVASGCGDFLNFSPVKILFRFQANEEFAALPTSKAAVFGDRKFSLVEKRSFMKLVSSVASSLAFNSPDKISASTTEVGPADWGEYLSSFGLSARQVEMVDACICFSGKIQETSEGIKKLKRFLESVGKFSEFQHAALLYANFGTSEILQAFARKAAVHGAVFALNAGISDHQNQLGRVTLSTGDMVESDHVFRASGNSNSIDSYSAIVRNSELSGECELRIQAGGSSLLVIGANSQCCPEGHAILYGRGPDGERLASEISGDILFFARVKAEEKLIYDKEDVDQVKRNFRDLGLGDFPY